MVRRFTLLTFAFAAVACARGGTAPTTTPSPSGTPDLVFLGAHVEGFENASAIAISNGKITAIGGKELANNAKSVRDLAGAWIMPGLRDAHVHLFGYGDVLLGRVCDLGPSTSEADALARVRAFVAARSLGPEDWVVCTGWNEMRWSERKKPSSTTTLDEAVGGRPAILSRQDGHTAWVSKRALVMAKIGRETNVRGGEVVKDASGEPTGILTDEAIGLVRRFQPPAKDEEIEAAIVRGLEECKRLGLVEVHDAEVFPRWERIFRKLATEGRLPIRVSAMVHLPTMKGIEEYMLANDPTTVPIGGRYVVRTIKLFADGALGGESAYLTAPYANRANWRGVSRATREEIASVAGIARRRGWQVATHAIGDAAIHDVLDGYADAGVDARARFRIEHASMTSEADVSRFAKLGVIASMQIGFPAPFHTTMLGDERAKQLWDPKRFLAAGVRVALGTDVPPGITAEPLNGIRVAIARGLPRADAVAFASEAVAYAAFAEDARGAIRVGHDADFTIYDADPFAKQRATVTGTYINGVVVR